MPSRQLCPFVAFEFKNWVQNQRTKNVTKGFDIDKLDELVIYTQAKRAEQNICFVKSTDTNADNLHLF